MVHQELERIMNLLFVCLLQEYLRLNMDYRQRALILLATGFGVDRGRVDGLIQHYLKLKSGVSNLTFLFDEKEHVRQVVCADDSHLVL
jgi:hypothetical protein